MGSDKIEKKPYDFPSIIDLENTAFVNISVDKIGNANKRKAESFESYVDKNNCGFYLSIYNESVTKKTLEGAFDQLLHFIKNRRKTTKKQLTIIFHIACNVTPLYSGYYIDTFDYDPKHVLSKCFRIDDIHSCLGVLSYSKVKSHLILDSQDLGKPITQVVSLRPRKSIEVYDFFSDRKLLDYYKIMLIGKSKKLGFFNQLPKPLIFEIMKHIDPQENRAEYKSITKY